MYKPEKLIPIKYNKKIIGNLRQKSEIEFTILYNDIHNIGNVKCFGDEDFAFNLHLFDASHNWNGKYKTPKKAAIEAIKKFEANYFLLRQIVEPKRHHD